MRLKDQITRIQQKPEHQRERIAVIATAVSFLIILAIWLVTFSEMNKNTQPEENSQATEQLNDIKSSAGQGKKSIEEMWSQMPTQEEMMNAEQQATPSNTGAGSNVADQDSLGGTGSEIQNPGSEQIPLDGNENSEIPSLP